MNREITIDGCNPSNWAAPEVFDSLLRGQVTAVNATTAIWENLDETTAEFDEWDSRFTEQSDKILRVLTTEDILSAYETGHCGIILGWQNLSPIEDDIDNLDSFHTRGLRIAQLVYNLRNRVAGGCYDAHDEGLSSFGVSAVKKLNELGILIDLSHVGDRSSLETIELSAQPVAFTHIQLRDFLESPRNKPKDLIRALVDKGGMVGANAYPAFLPGGFEATIVEYLDGLEQLVELAGIEHVGIATDLCESQTWDFWNSLGKMHPPDIDFEALLPSPEPATRGLESNSDVYRIVQELNNRGYATGDIWKIFFGGGGMDVSFSRGVVRVTICDLFRHELSSPNALALFTLTADHQHFPEEETCPFHVKE